MSADHSLEIGADFQEKLVKRFLLKASKNIDIITWSITNFTVKLDDYNFSKISDLLYKMTKEKGIKIRIVFGNENNIEIVKKFFSFPGCEARLLTSNHAKIMIIDDVIGYVGSGNFTGSGIGSNWSKNHFNLEVSVLFWEEKDIMKLKKYFEISWRYAKKLF